jgi:hypothetical protein
MNEPFACYDGKPDCHCEEQSDEAIQKLAGSNGAK